MRERWFGATGRRVPEIAVEGELDVEGALVLDDVDDPELLRRAHDEGKPVVVQANPCVIEAYLGADAEAVA